MNEMGVNPAVEIELRRAAFSDVDHMVEWSQGLGWDNVGTQLTPGTNQICFDSFALPGLLVGHYCVQRSIHNVFTLPEGMVLFVICRAKLPLVWCGRHLPPTMLGIARRGLEHEVVLHAGWDCYEFMISEDLIGRTEIFPPDFFEETAQLERAFLPLMEPITGRFLRRMDTYFRLGRNANERRHTAVHSGQFFDFITQGLLRVIDAGLSARGSLALRYARRSDLVNKARDFVSAHLANELSADDLSQALGVSNRVLSYAFKDSLGISPYQYIMTQKLHAVRRQLKLGVPVTLAGLAHGFNTPSRFARQYFRLFGELPSATRCPERHRGA